MAVALVAKVLIVALATVACQGSFASSDLVRDGVSGQKSLFGPLDRGDWMSRFGSAEKDEFIASLITNMTVDDLVLQLHLMFGDNLVGPNVDDKQYDHTMRFGPGSPVGNIHDFYSLNTSRHNDLQRRNLAAVRLPIPFLHFGECLHGVGSFQQSLFPQALGLAASFDTSLVHRVGRAIGTEARSIGIHACFAPVLDLGRDPRWGRTQEGWGEDRVLTADMGVAYASGLSKNGSWSDPDAVVPVMKHFAAHGSPQSGRNTAPFVGHGMRELLQELLVPFKAAVDLGGVRGVMMAYNELDGIPAAVHPLLYEQLRAWNFDGFVIADDTAVRELHTVHRVAASPADAFGQWLNAGGMIQFYDYSLETFLNATKDLLSSGTVALSTLQARVRTILGVKWDLGLFHRPLIPDDVDPVQLVAGHRALVLEAAQKSVVLLKNANNTLPLLDRREAGEVKKLPARVALLGPFADTLNYGDYSGTWGQTPAAHALTMRQALLAHFSNVSEGEDGSQRLPPPQLLSRWGADSWEYSSQNVIPPYLLSSPDGTSGGLRATYYPHTDFTGDPVVLQEPQMPALDWGLFPPPGLPSANFSAIWEGVLASPVDDAAVQSWIGVAVGPHSVSKLYIDDELLVVTGSENGSSASSSNILGNILPWSWVQAGNGSNAPPPGAALFAFRPHAVYRIRIEFQAWGAAFALKENERSLRSQMLLFWNLVGHEEEDPSTTPIDRAVAVARHADIVVLAVGAAWNSDGENGDRSTLDLPPSQEALVEAVLTETTNTNTPVVLVLFGGRPFAIPQHYSRAAAVVSAFFPGPAGGQAIADVLVGFVDPGGARLPRTVPRAVGQLPVRYDYKPSARSAQYIDATPEDTAPCFPFGHGLSYTDFSVTSFTAVTSSSSSTFSPGGNITFSARVHNTGSRPGSYTMQVYLLGCVSTVTRPVRQLVAFQRVELQAGEAATVMAPAVDADRYLQILDRQDKWLLERGDYEFALREDGGDAAQEHGRVTLACV